MTENNTASINAKRVRRYFLVAQGLVAMGCVTVFISTGLHILSAFLARDPTVEVFDFDTILMIAHPLCSRSPRINEKFYPEPFLPATKQPNGTWHYGRKKSGYLTKKRFERVYDRLGKFMHAHNPWSPEKHMRNLATSIPDTIGQLRALLELHGAFIRTSSFKGAWVVEMPSDGSPPKIITGAATGDFVVNGS